jgi:hypothetical protein
METTETPTRYGAYPDKYRGQDFGQHSRWSSVSEDDGTYKVAVPRGWGIVTEASFSGLDARQHAHAFAMSVV